MHLKLHNHSLVSNAKTLRKNMTEQERKLWYTFLKKQPFHFARQKVIGNYIVDFYCYSKKLIIEIDGTQHYIDNGIEADKIRDDFLNKNGYKVLRFTNLDVNNNFENVCNEIYLILTGNKE